MRRALSGEHSSRSVRQRSADVHCEIRSPQTPLTPQRVIGVRNRHLFIGAELLSSLQNTFCYFWRHIAGLTPVPEISFKILQFPVFFCFAQLFPWPNLTLTATSLQSSNCYNIADSYLFLPTKMVAVKCINRIPFATSDVTSLQVCVVRSIIVVISIVYIRFVLQIVVAITLLLNSRDNSSHYCSLSNNMHGFVFVLIIKS